MNKTIKYVLIFFLIIGAVFYFFTPKRKVRRRKHTAVNHVHKVRSRSHRVASFKPRSRGKRSSGSKKMMTLHGKKYTPKAWGAAMKRLRKQRA